MSLDQFPGTKPISTNSELGSVGAPYTDRKPVPPHLINSKYCLAGTSYALMVDGATLRSSAVTAGTPSGELMTRFLTIALAVALIASPAAAGMVFNYEQFGSTIPSDCPPQFPAPPLCNIIDATGIANDVPDVIPGVWSVTLHGQVLFFEGSGTFLFDDVSPSDNDFFGTWTNVLFPPDPSGLAHSIFQWIVTGGTGIFAGLSGFGTSMGDVVIAPAGFDSQGMPIFVAACPDAQAGLGSYCDRGLFVIPEPGTLVLLLAALAGVSWRRGGARSG